MPSKTLECSLIGKNEPQQSPLFLHLEGVGTYRGFNSRGSPEKPGEEAGGGTGQEACAADSIIGARWSRDHHIRLSIGGEMGTIDKADIVGVEQKV